MDTNRFDALVASLADPGSSRRSFLGRLAGGGFAAALAGLGMHGFDPEDSEAKKNKGCARCKKKNSSSKRRRCRRRCHKTSGGGGGSAGFTIISLSDVGEPCTSSATCNTGNCLFVPLVGGTCQACDPLLVCGNPGNQQCCVIGADCINGICANP